MNAPLLIPATFALVTLTFLPAAAQELMRSAGAGAVRLMNSDLAVLETGEARTDLPCSVTAVKPELGFDLKLHAGYRATLPFEEVPAGTEMFAIVRVRNTKGGEPVHFRQRLVSAPPPNSPEDAIGQFDGYFAVGEGDYQVDWLLRDRAGRVCSNFWTVKAALPEKYGDMTKVMPGGVQPLDPDPFHNEPFQNKDSLETLPSVTVLLNFAPFDRSSSLLSDNERNALLSMLRNVIQDPRIGRTSLVVFNLEQQQVLYREKETIDFRAVQKAVDSLQLGTIAIDALEKKEDGPAQFLAGLVQEATKENPPSALLFVGPAGGPSPRLSDEIAATIKANNCQFFYLNYNPVPAAAPWTDIIGKAVQFVKGRYYAIQQPRDLLSAWADMISRLRGTSGAGHTAAFRGGH